jgi:hypothetical protein
MFATGDEGFFTTYIDQNLDNLRLGLFFFFSLIIFNGSNVGAVIIKKI